MSFVTYDCQTCGACLDVQPDNLLTICAYCGNIHKSKSIGDVPVHIVPSRSQQDIIAAVNHRMANDRDMKGKKYTKSVKPPRADGIHSVSYRTSGFPGQALPEISACRGRAGP